MIDGAYAAAAADVDACAMPPSLQSGSEEKREERGERSESTDADGLREGGRGVRRREDERCVRRRGSDSDTASNMEASKTGNKNVDRPQNRDHECDGFVGAAERARHFAAASLSDPYSDPRWAARHSAAMTDRQTWLDFPCGPTAADPSRRSQRFTPLIVSSIQRHRPAALASVATAAPPTQCRMFVTNYMSASYHVIVVGRPVGPCGDGLGLGGS